MFPCMLGARAEDHGKHRDPRNTELRAVCNSVPVRACTHARHGSPTQWRSALIGVCRTMHANGQGSGPTASGPCPLPVSQRQRSLGCRQKLRTPRAAPVLPGCVGRRRGKIICAILKFGGTACFWVLEDFAVQCVVSLDHARSPLRQRRAPPRAGRLAGRRIRVNRRPPPGGGKSRRSSGDRQ